MSLQKAIDPTISMMEVEDKPDVTYDDIGGATESLKLLREVVEIPILHPERFVNLGIDPPKGKSCLSESLSRCAAVWTSRHRKNPDCHSCRQSNGSLFHSCHW